MRPPLKPDEKSRRAIIGDRIRRVRESNNWTMKDLAERLNSSSAGAFRFGRQTIAKIERGNYRLPTELIEALAAATKLDAKELAAPEGGIPPRAHLKSFVADKTPTIEFRALAQRILLKAGQERYNEATAAKRAGRFINPLIFQRATPTTHEIENSADLLRRRWELGTAPISNLIYTLERMAVTVVQKSESDETIVCAGSVSSWPVVLWRGPEPQSTDEIAEFRFRVLRTLILMLGNRVRDRPRDVRDRAERITRAVFLPRVAVTDTFGTKRNQITLENVISMASIHLLPLHEAVERLIEVDLIDRARAESIRRASRHSQLMPLAEKSSWKLLLPAPFQHLPK